MMILGLLLVVVALGAGVFGVVQFFKMKTINSAPMRKTGEVQGGAGSDGMLSCEGTIEAQEPLLAPCSGKPCVYYKITIKQEWEEHVATENGTKRKTGKNNAHTEQTGAVFHVNDGSGPIPIDAREGVDAKLEKSFSEKKSYGWGDITFGNFTTHINRPADSKKHAIATYCTEEILPAEGPMFVVGQFDGQNIRKKSAMGGKLILAREGASKLLGATKRNMIIGFAAAGVLVPVGTVMAILAPPPSAAASACENMTDDIPEACNGRMYGADDVVYSWTVNEPGEYRFEAVGTGSDPYYRLWPEVDVVDAQGNVVFELDAHDGEEVSEVGHFDPGVYTVEVNDSHFGWAENLEGGAGFRLEIDLVASDAPSEEPAVGAAEAEATGGEAPPEAADPATP